MIKTTPGFPRNPSLAPLPLLSTVCSIFSGPRAPARQMVVRITLCTCLEGREGPENRPNSEDKFCACNYAFLVLGGCILGWFTACYQSLHDVDLIPDLILVLIPQLFQPAGRSGPS